jgi:hypothetical protein
MSLRNRLTKLEGNRGPDGCPACRGVELVRVVWPADDPERAQSPRRPDTCGACGRGPDVVIEVEYVAWPPRSAA